MHDRQLDEFDLDGVNVYREEPKDKYTFNPSKKKNSWVNEIYNGDAFRNIRKLVERTDKTINQVTSIVQDEVQADDFKLSDLAIKAERKTEVNNIEPDHYRKGEIDLFESWYRTRPFSEFRAIMESIAERYMKRIKNNRLEDLDKPIYTLQRLREYEEKEVAE